MADIFFSDLSIGDHLDYSNTVRVYETNSDNTNKDLMINGVYDSTVSKEVASINRNAPLMVAPFQQITINGTNEWIAATASIKDAFLKALKDSYANVHEVVAQNSNSNWMSTKQYISSDVTKNYNGSSFSLPITSVSATYFSSYGVLGQVSVPGYQPTYKLKDYARDLIKKLVGNIHEDDTGNGVSSAVIKATAPLGYSPSASTHWTNYKGTLTLMVGDGIQIDKVLPKSISIVPSRYLTPDDDFFSLTVTLEFEECTLYDTNTVLDWITKSGW